MCSCSWLLIVGATTSSADISAVVVDISSVVSVADIVVVASVAVVVVVNSSIVVAAVVSVHDSACAITKFSSLSYHIRKHLPYYPQLAPPPIKQRFN